MKCVVEGNTISTDEWEDDSWQPPPGFRAQEKRRLELRQATPDPKDAEQTRPPRNDPKPRPPPQRRRGPLPRMPADAIHIVGRPKAPIDLTKLPPWQLYEALLKAASLPDQPPASRDQVRVHPTNNTFTLSVQDSARAKTYLQVTSLKFGDQAIEIHIYAPPPDDAFRGIMFHAFDNFSDEEILQDLQESNPNMPVVGGRRMGRTSHILVTMLGDHLPRWIFYHGVHIRLYPFYRKVEACFNCRKVGHRTDVCPHPRRNRCSRCGEDHPPAPQDAQPTCQARCIVCNGGHTTNSSNCKYRFVKKPTPSGPNSNRSKSPRRPSILRTGRSPSRDQSFPPLGQPPQQERASRSRSRTGNRSPSRSRSRSRTPSTSRYFLASSSRGASTSVDCSLDSTKGSSQSSSGPTKVAWAQGPPSSLKSSSQDPSQDTQVRELVRENTSLKARLSSQQSQISTLLSQIENLTQHIQSLDSKLNRALTQPPVTTTVPQQQQPQAAAAGKRKATTSTESLQIDASITGAVTKAVAEAFQASDAKLESRFNALDAKFETRLNTMQQAIDARFANLEQAIGNTHASYNTLKQHTENALASVHKHLGRHRSSSRSRPSTPQGATPMN